MASIRKRNGRYQVQVRVAGFPPQSRTFMQRKAAERWARATELSCENGQLGDRSSLKETLGQILARYDKEIASKKLSYVQEANRLKRLLGDPVSATPLSGLTPHILAQFRDRRLGDGRRTCIYDLVLIRHALNIARKEWGYPLAFNPADQITRPKLARARDRRLERGEYERLEAGCVHGRASYLWPLINLAIETGMRLGELLALTWEQIDSEKRTAFLPITKNGLPRTIPLSGEALHWLGQFPRTGPKVVHASRVAVRQAWDRLRTRSKINGLHFHDLRHEAISRFFERGLSVPEVALISGHQDFRMLSRYTHLRAEDLSRKLQLLDQLRP